MKQEVEPTVNFKEDEVDVVNIDTQQATNKSTHDLQNNCTDSIGLLRFIVVNDKFDNNLVSTFC